MLPREELLEMIGMETLLKEKRIVDLRGKARERASASGSESTTGS